MCCLLVSGYLVSCQLSVISYQKKGVNLKLALNCPLSLILALGSWLFLVICYQLSVVRKKQEISNEH